jgi:hypothetical protein
MNKRFVFRKFEMKYYSAFMHKFLARKKKTRNLLVSIFLKLENLFEMWKLKFRLYMDKDSKFIKCTCCYI